MGKGISGEVGLAEAPYDQWVLLGPAERSARPCARYKHAAEVVQDKLYVVGGSRNGRSLSDVQVFDFRTFRWSALNPKRNQNQLNHENNDTDRPFPALAGHSLVNIPSFSSKDCLLYSDRVFFTQVKWKNNLLVVAGKIRSASTLNKLSVWLIDVDTDSWSALDTYGKVPIARSGQSVSLLGSQIIMFGGEDNKRRLLNDLHILDLETMMWEEVKTAKGGPAARYDHSAAIYADLYLLIFGGSSHSTCFNDFYLLDLQTLEWSRPDTQGAHISPRSGHAGTMIDENWYIVGGGNNASGSTDTIVLNVSKFVWSVAASVSARDPLACEGLTLCSATVDGKKFLIAFGGYNGKYNNEIFILKVMPRNLVQGRPTSRVPPPASTSATRVIFSNADMGSAFQKRSLRKLAMETLQGNWEGQHEEALGSALCLASDPESSSCALVLNLAGDLLLEARARMIDSDTELAWHRLEMACSMYKKAVAVAPNCIQTAAAYASALLESHQPEEAKFILTQSITKPDDPYLHHVVYALEGASSREQRFETAQLKHKLAVCASTRALCDDAVSKVVTLLDGSNAASTILAMAEDVRRRNPKSARAQHLPCYVTVQLMSNPVWNESKRKTKMENAVRRMTDVALAFNKSLPISLLLAKLYVVSGKYDAAARECHRVLQIQNPDDPHLSDLPKESTPGAQASERISYLQLQISQLLKWVENKECLENDKKSSDGRHFGEILDAVFFHPRDILDGSFDLEEQVASIIVEDPRNAMDRSTMECTKAEGSQSRPKNHAWMYQRPEKVAPAQVSRFLQITNDGLAYDPYKDILVHQAYVRELSRKLSAKPPVHACSYCFFELNTTIGVRQDIHHYSTHGFVGIKCESCSAKFTTLTALEWHKRYIHHLDLG